MPICFLSDLFYYRINSYEELINKQIKTLIGWDMGYNISNNFWVIFIASVSAYSLTVKSKIRKKRYNTEL